MKINDTQRLSMMQKAYGMNRAGGSSSADSLRKRDEVSISSEAMGLLHTRQLEHSGKAEQIEKLKEAVSTGTYYVDSGKLAEKLLPFLLK